MASNGQMELESLTGMENVNESLTGSQSFLSSFWPRHLDLLGIQISALLGLFCGYLWEWYGDGIKMWVFDRGTTTYTRTRLALAPYYSSFSTVVNPYFDAYVAPYAGPYIRGILGKQPAYYIHRVTLHYRRTSKQQQQQQQKTLRVELPSDGLEMLRCGNLTPATFTDLGDLQALCLEYSRDDSNQRFFRLMPYGLDKDWCGEQRFVPEQVACSNNDYTVTEPEDLGDPLNYAIKAYLDDSPAPGETLNYLCDHPEVFEIPEYPGLKKVADEGLRRFFEDKVPIILEDDLGDLRQVGL